MGGETDRLGQQPAGQDHGQATEGASTGGVLAPGPHKVTASWLRIRRDPHIAKDNIITSVPHGTALNVVGPPQNGFYPVTHGSVQGFSSGHYLEGSATGSGMAAVRRIITTEQPATTATTATAARPAQPTTPITEAPHLTETLGPDSEQEKQRDAQKQALITAAAQSAAGNHVAAGMAKLNSGEMGVAQIGDAYIHLNGGIAYAHNFQKDILIAKGVVEAPKSHTESDVATAQKALGSRPIKAWSDELYDGYANPAYFERIGFMSWRIVPGKSASAAITAFIEGLTIAECWTTMAALEWDAARQAMGNAAFDAAYDGKLEIREGGVPPVVSQTPGASAAHAGRGAGVVGHRPADVGDWYYFCNHPKYLLKHPGGAWQGENAVLTRVTDGVQYWSGLGADEQTEDAMLQDLVDAYNADRGPRDTQVLEQETKAYGRLPDELDPKKKMYPDKITKEDILTAPPYTYGGQTRRGGFRIEDGKHLDVRRLPKLGNS